MLKALSDEVRWQVVRILMEETRARVTDLATRLKITQPTMSKHLRMLRDAGIVISEKEGKVVWCQIAPEFRQQLRGGESVLNLGCCTFCFDEPKQS